MGTLLLDCTLIDCTGAPPLTDAAILVEHGRLTDIGPRAEVLRRASDGHEVRALDGDTVLPGLWDAHVHLGAVVPPWEDRFRGEVEAHYAYRVVRKATDNLLSGITSLRTMGDRNNADLQLKRAIESGTLVGPRLWVAGDVMWSREAAGVDAFRAKARERLRQGVDHVKLFATGGIAWPAETIAHTICTPEELRAAVEEAHRWHKPVAVHAIGDEGVIMAAEAGADSVEHGFVLGEAGIEAMVRNATVFSPQLCVTKAWNEDTIRDAGCFPDWFLTNAIEASEVHHAMVRKAIHAGLTIVCGVDNLTRLPWSPGIETFEGLPALISEIRFAAECGLTPMQALQAATINTARACRADRDLGTLERGKRADLIAVAGDPLANLDALFDVRLVMKGGSVVRDDRRPLPAGAPTLARVP
ncbi:MAG: amidohydrolase family protein [Chloroflexi bacterium]|nr:amidohydrolase family protein [Chloroflexota bacterium]